MRILALCASLTLAAAPALAGDLALVVGTERYDTLPRLSRAAEPTVATSGISALGFDVAVLRNGNAEDTRAALVRFLGEVPQAGRLIVALSGRFVTDGNRTWYLPADALRPALIDVGGDGVSLESLLAVLARAPGQALLLLAADPRATGDFDPWLHEGIGALAVPQGVTVLTGEPRPVAEFMQNALARPEGDLAALIAADGRLQAQGFLPAPFAFMPPLAEAVVPATPDDADIAADDALWRRVVAQDNVEAYRGYLRQFPQGRHASEATAAVAAILAEPFRDERLAEEALGLTRDQRRGVQTDLTTLGFDTRGIDGIFGQGSRRAIANWQQENGFAQSGYLGMEQIQRLSAQAARRQAEAAAEAERQRQAAERLDRAYWEETGAIGDEAGLNAYLGRYPSGVFAADARRALERLTAERAAAQAAREASAWDSARGRGTIEAFRAYLRDFPQGAHAAEARARIAALEAPVTPEPEPEPEVDGALGAEIERARAAEAELGLNALTARLVESRLAALGLDPGPVDGRFDSSTRDALRRYQERNGLIVTGYLDEGTVARLLAGVLDD
ncbi:MAG: peptidoglycan-binding protein [Rubellimicrobium sp.]|nr:peptidoglycan-binding protein [Rubellimicrobium sp.]